MIEYFGRGMAETTVKHIWISDTELKDLIYFLKRQGDKYLSFPQNGKWQIVSMYNDRIKSGCDAENAERQVQILDSYFPPSGEKKVLKRKKSAPKKKDKKKANKKGVKKA